MTSLTPAGTAHGPTRRGAFGTGRQTVVSMPSNTTRTLGRYVHGSRSRCQTVGLYPRSHASRSSSKRVLRKYARRRAASGLGKSGRKSMSDPVVW